MMRTRLERLEGASIRFLWEATAAARRPALLNGDDRESLAILELVRKAFFPGPLPFPVLTPEELEGARAAQGFDLILRGTIDALGTGSRSRPVWRLAGAARRPEQALASPLAGWTADDVQHYIERDMGFVPSLWLHTCGDPAVERARSARGSPAPSAPRRHGASSSTMSPVKIATRAVSSPPPPTPT